MTIQNEILEKYGNNNFKRNEYQGHIVWCFHKLLKGHCFGVNFFSIKSYDTKWVSRILNDPTLDYACRWCGTKGQFNSIMFMNDELTPAFYGDFKAGKIDKCVSYISKFLSTNGYRINKESLKVIMNKLFTYEESLDED